VNTKAIATPTQSTKTVAIPTRSTATDVKIFIIVAIASVIATIVFFAFALGGEKADSSLMTLSNFNQIQVGMARSEVTSIVGSSGTVTGQSDNIIVVQYEGSGAIGANALITFVDGVVESKAQAGLK
jgi:hypothetical protein